MKYLVGTMTRRAGPAVLGILLLMTAAFTACATPQQGADPLLVKSQQAEAIAFDAIDGILKIEYTNRAAFAKAIPNGTAIADDIRKKAPDAFHAVDKAVDAYRKAKLAGDPTDAATSAVNGELAALQSVLQSAIDLTAKWNASKPKAYMTPPIRAGDPPPMFAVIFLAISFSSILPGIISVLSLAVTALGGPALGTLAGSLATILLNTIEKISADASQSAELSDADLAAVRKARDDAFASWPEWKPSTDAGSTGGDQ